MLPGRSEYTGVSKQLALILVGLLSLIGYFEAIDSTHSLPTELLLYGIGCICTPMAGRRSRNPGAVCCLYESRRRGGCTDREEDVRTKRRMYGPRGGCTDREKDVHCNCSDSVTWPEQMPRQPCGWRCATAATPEALLHPAIGPTAVLLLMSRNLPPIRVPIAASFTLRYS